MKIFIFAHFLAVILSLIVPGHHGVQAKMSLQPTDKPLSIPFHRLTHLTSAFDQTLLTADLLKDSLTPNHQQNAIEPTVFPTDDVQTQPERLRFNWIWLVILLLLGYAIGNILFMFPSREGDSE